MLERTFVHLKGIGPAGEADLWSRGFETWSDLISSGRADPRARRVIEGAEASQRRLDAGDAAYFHVALPSAERWRLCPDFLDSTAFLDIETTGLSPEESMITLVGILDRHGFTAYIRGDNLEELPAVLARYKLFVTFNGAAFDLPFLQREFNEFDRDLFGHAAHLDLRYPLRRLGLVGGLKKIELVTGTGRPSALSKLRGADAVTLWRMANEGEPGALETLIRYNAEDVASLPGLTALAVQQLAAGLPMDFRPALHYPGFDRDSMPYDALLVQYLTRTRP